MIKAARLSGCAQTEGVAASRSSGMHRVTQSTPLFSRREQSKLRQTSNALIRLLCARNVNRKSTLVRERKSVRVERGKGRRALAILPLVSGSYYESPGETRSAYLD
ncbi:uncharacterized [Tachysurus ichikawai]